LTKLQGQLCAFNQKIDEARKDVDRQSLGCYNAKQMRGHWRLRMGWEELTKKIATGHKKVLTNDQELWYTTRGESGRGKSFLFAQSGVKFSTRS
jgi:hypothetical protein